MPSPVLNVSQISQSIQYTGSNSADIVSQVPGLTFDSEVGGVLTVLYNGNPMVLATNDWVIFNPFVTFPMGNTQYLAEWQCVSVCDDLGSLETDIDGLETDLAALETQVNAISVGTPVRSIGVAPVPTLVLNASATVAVTLAPAMPNTSYTPYAKLFAGISIVGLTINSVTVVNASTVNVVVQNLGLVTLAGANVMVTVHA